MKKALLVVDLQNDYLWETRKEKFIYNTSLIIKSVNQIIKQYQSNGCDVIYIAQILENNWFYRNIFGFSIRGTEGANFYSDLNIVSDYYFEKTFPSAFSSKKFVKFINEKQYDSVAICGIDECGCVSATAKGALKQGLSVEMLVSGIATTFSNSKVEKIRANLKSKDVKYI